MGCCGDREKGPTKESQKWQYITLNDFKSTSAWNTPAYVWLWILFISTIVIYAVDTFTAVNLLIFNKWSSQVKPYIPFEYSKWIFAGCILFSWALWAFEWLRAIRVINRGGVAESYMDPLAVSLQSMRKLGWRRFLVFAELTKSKKGMDLVAFFTYFAFKGAIRIILAEGPRQVINTLTLIAVVKADFVDKNGDHSSSSGIGLFWSNLQAMWNDDKLQAVIIFSMMYSLLIWAISIICLASAAIAYIVFLWHYIPQQDGGLSSFCKRKVDKRLEKIVESKVKAGIEEEERKRRKAEEKEYKLAQKAEKKGKFDGAAPVAPGITRQPTLPQLDTLGKDDDSMDNFPLRRTETGASVSTLPLYASRPSTRNENKPLPGYGERPQAPSRSATNGSQWTTASYESDAPLLPNAAQNGESFPVRPPPAFNRQDSNASFGRPGQNAFSRQDSNAFSRQDSNAFSRQDSNAFGRPPMSRPMTPGSQRPYSPAPGMHSQDRSFSPMSRTDFSQNASGPGPQYTNQRPESPYGRPGMPTETAFGRSGTPGGPPSRRGTNTSYDRNIPSRTGTAASFDRSVYSRDAAMPLDGSAPPRTTATPFDYPPTSMSRQPTAASTNSNASFSRPLPPLQKPSQSFNRPFTPSSNSSTPGNNSYEMKPNPYITRAPTVESPTSYVAFNPNRTASPAPPPQRSNSNTTQDYFSHRTADAPQRSLTAPEVDNRATIGYSDIVDDYGSHTPGSASSPGTHRQPGYNQQF